MKKRIGVLAAMHGSIVGITYPYFDFASKYGEVILINPLEEGIRTDIDVLILTGGADLDPARYGAKPSLHTNKPNPHREWFDINVLPDYIKAETPIFGICLGLQSINAYFGGTLVQHNSLYHPFSYKSRDDLVHELVITEDGNFDDRFMFNNDFKKLRVNSLHHQEVDVLGEGLIVHGIDNKNDMTAEIIAHKTLPIVAVQFHPEELEGEKIMHVIDRYMHYLLN